MDIWDEEHLDPVLHWEHEGMRCHAIHTGNFTWCGYVEPVLPGIENQVRARLLSPNISVWETEDLDIHGGVTFTNRLNHFEGKPFAVGFDCGHAGDLAPFSPEVRRLLSGRMSRELGNGDTYRDKAFVIEQTNSLATQIKTTLQKEES